MNAVSSDTAVPAATLTFTDWTPLSAGVTTSCGTRIKAHPTPKLLAREVPWLYLTFK